MAPLRYYASDAQPTTLAAALSSVTPGSLGTVEVEAVTDWPTQYPFTILIDWGTGSQEVATITQAPTGTGPYIFANTVRGDDGSLSPAHSAGATVVHGVSARDFAQPQEHINGFLQGMAPVGITGATVATRYVGGVTGDAPTTGTFETGDWVADTGGTLWFCTAGGSPGTWSQVTASGTGGGGVQIGGDIGNTDAAPHVISTHLSSPLPLAQGGTGQDAASDTALLTALGALQVANNLSDLASATTARTNLGLGTAATQASSAFDAAGAASTAQSNAISTAETYANSTFVPLSEVGVASGIAPLDSSGLVAVSHIPQLADYAPTGLTGATAASRHVGATASGAPTSGTFAVGDFLIDQTGAIWICTTAGSPGTWTKPTGSTTTIDGVTVSGTPSSGQVLTATSATAADWQNPASGFANPMTTLGDIIYENSTPAPARLAGSTSATKQFLTQTGTGTVSAAPAWGAIAAADLPSGTTGAKGALQLDGTATDIQALGTQAAGASGLAADGKHVHPTTGLVVQSGSTMTGWLAPAAVALTFGTTIAVNAALGNAFNLTLTASTGTISNPTNPVDGQTIRFRITQGTGGSFTVAWGTAFNFGSGSAPTLSTAAGDVDIVAFEYIASKSYWRYLGIALD